MKRILLITTFISIFFTVFAQDIKLKLEDKNSYDENMKYDNIQKYTEEKEKKKESDVDIDVNVDINKEQKTIDKLKLDMGTKF